MSSDQPMGATGARVSTDACMDAKKQQLTIATIVGAIAKKNDCLATYLLNLSESANLLSVKMTGEGAIDRSELLAQLGRDRDDEVVDEDGPAKTEPSHSFDDLLRDYERRLSVCSDIIGAFQRLI